MATIGALALASGNPLAPPPSAPTSPAATPPAATSNAPETHLPGGPSPLIAANKPVKWWFAFKFDAGSSSTEVDDARRACPFGGSKITDPFSQSYVYATDGAPALANGPGLIGSSTGDPVGATFDEIYNGDYYYVVWNDQFKGDPVITGSNCNAKACESPWGHSKGILAWDRNGDGVVIQVTTPSWPGSGSQRSPRAAGNTLGCVTNDNDVENAQHFFALKLNHNDVKTVLQALATASVSTDVSNPQLVGRSVLGQSGPADLDQLVTTLGQRSTTKAYQDTVLSSGVRLIVKPSALHVPPWQFVSSRLGSEPLLTATWWASPRIPSTKSQSDIHCWDNALAPSGEVDVATGGSWSTTEMSLKGPPNHAKIGVSLQNGHHYAIFGDLNQQGKLGDAGKPDDAHICSSSQNGRGGMFFVLENEPLSDGIRTLIGKGIAPVAQ